MLFEAARPILLNGIEDVISRADLADCAIFLTWRPSPRSSGAPRPSSGASLSSRGQPSWAPCSMRLAEGLRELPRVRLERLPRMKAASEAEAISASNGP